MKTLQTTLVFMKDSETEFILVVTLKKQLILENLKIKKLLQQGLVSSNLMKTQLFLIMIERDNIM